MFPLLLLLVLLAVLVLQPLLPLLLIPGILLGTVGRTLASYARPKLRSRMRNCEPLQDTTSSRWSESAAAK